MFEKSSAAILGFRSLLTHLLMGRPPGCRVQHRANPKRLFIDPSSLNCLQAGCYFRTNGDIVIGRT